MFCNILKIKKLILTSFMGAKGELVINFNDNLINDFIGDNGKGKSLILNALCFVFCGTDSFGNKKNFYTNESGIESFTSVECVFQENDSINSLKRTLKVSNTGRNEISIYKDALKLKQSDWDKQCDKDIFLSLINPKYLSSLKTSDLRTVLLKFIKNENVNYKNFIDELITIVSDYEFEIFDDFRNYFLETQKIVEKRNKEKENEEDKNIDIFEYVLNEVKTNISSIKEKIKKSNEKISFIENQEPIISYDVSYKYKENCFTDSMNDSEFFKMILDNYMKDPSNENKIHVENFSEIRKLIAINKYRENCRKSELETADNLRQEVLDIELELSKYERYNKFLSLIDDRIINTINDEFETLKIQFTNKYNKNEFNILYNNVLLSDCSYSEQIHSSLLLIDNLSLLLDVNFPFFIDNAESITTMPELEQKHQIINLYVVKGYELSLYKDDCIEEVKSKKALPKIEKSVIIKNKILGSDFEHSK